MTNSELYADFKRLVREQKKAQQAKQKQADYDRFMFIKNATFFEIEKYYHDNVKPRLGNCDFIEIEGSENGMKIFETITQRNCGVKKLILTADGKKIKTINFFDNEYESIPVKL